MLAQIRVGATRTNLNFGGENFDATQLRKIPDTDQLAPNQFARCVLHHHVCAAGDREPYAGLLRQKR